MNDSRHAWALFLLALHNCRFVRGADVPQLLNASPGAELRRVGGLLLKDFACQRACFEPWHGAVGGVLGTLPPLVGQAGYSGLAERPRVSLGLNNGGFGERRPSGLVLSQPKWREMLTGADRPSSGT